MTNEIWQTTNQQPWVEALASGLISCKTRIAQPHVPIGATVLLHASKSRLWGPWKGLVWARKMNPENWPRGCVVAVAEVADHGPTSVVMRENEYRFWDVIENGPGYPRWNSAAPWTVRFKNIVRLHVPVCAKGMLTPFARAKKETIKAVYQANKEQLLNYPGFND